MNYELDSLQRCWIFYEPRGEIRRSRLSQLRDQQILKEQTDHQSTAHLACL